MNRTKLALVLSSLLITGCASTGTPYSFDSDIAGGTITFTATDKCGGGVEWMRAQMEANELCSSWDYDNAVPHVGVKMNCLQSSSGSFCACDVMQYERVYRCVMAPEQ